MRNSYMARRRISVALTALLFIVYTIQSTIAEEHFTLTWPLECKLHETCFIQNYVDHDPSDQILDFHCGRRTYDGHDGTDIRLPDLEAEKKGVRVFAVASGTIVRSRDDMDDVSVKTADRSAVVGRECGNGVIIDHGNGWSSQYCHMTKNSIALKPGASVVSGQAIGFAGLSGDTEFAHLHITIRHNGTVVDPFSEGAAQNQCNAGRSLWSSELSYEPTEIINVGFADQAMTMEQIELGELNHFLPTSHSAAMVAYVRAIGLQTGDEQFIELSSPNGTILSGYNAPKLARDQAQYFMTTGKKLDGSEWPSGTYAATFIVRRNGGEILRRTFEAKITN
ncbi:M23 family metallopeptidase [Bradyrhizobium manausense]|uniref:M23 family metallopeptidase n=1 Tax=Bradyrhizobium manausense TaxID=989370 RepID=UPI001BAAE223|nr:M23 family metallopeptidase [Bradyrhizobium manausense]MBR1092273.1 M23 family metallopeptidase [Bradyrhizobium manausense]